MGNWVSRMMNVTSCLMLSFKALSYSSSVACISFFFSFSSRVSLTIVSAHFSRKMRLHNNTSFQCFQLRLICFWLQLKFSKNDISGLPPRAGRWIHTMQSFHRNNQILIRSWIIHTVDVGVMSCKISQFPNEITHLFRTRQPFFWWEYTLIHTHTHTHWNW